MQRLLIVYNPRSSRSRDVRRDVLSPAASLKGYLIGKYEVKPTSIDDNIATLAKLLKDGDIVISAGGDATGVIASNSILKSGKDARLAALPYGNFNDLARTLGTKKLEDIITRQDPPHDFYPLEISVDGKFFRYATCYVTIGMTAEAAKIYDRPKVRRKLKSKFGRRINSYTSVAGWYFRHRHQKPFIPNFTLNGTPQPQNTSDYIAVNGKSMARVMKGGEDYLDPKTFHSTTARLARFHRLTSLMVKSIFRRIPGTPTSGDTLIFTHPATITLQAEGEYYTFTSVKQVEIQKSPQPLKVITATKHIPK